MASNQPVWKLIANLGDVNPVDYGGLFVYQDETGVYPPEVELLESPDDDEGNWIAYRFILEPCTFINGILSDNSFHPDSPAWFADSISQVADCVGADVDTFIADLCGDDILARARAWSDIGQYHGMANLDSYPLEFTGRDEVEKRYATPATD